MKIPSIGTVLLFLVIVFLSGFQASWVPSFLSLATLLILCISFYPLIRILFPDRADSCILTIPAGYIVHAVLLSFAGLIFGIHMRTGFLYLLAAAAVFIFLYRRQAGHVGIVSDWSKTDWLLLFAWLFVTIAIVAIPFVRVGEKTAEGFAYRAYFNADFFRNLAVSGALSSSGIPPDNPYMAGNTLHYYWFFHVVPAFWNKMFPSFRSDFLMVQFSIVALLMFVSTLFVTLRRFIQNRRTLLFLLPVFAVGGSYEGLYVLQWLNKRNMPWTEFVNLNIDGILRWNWKAPQIDTLYRALLYAPQHLVALAVLLIALLIWNEERSGGEPLANRARKTVFYILIFSTVGFSAFIGSTLVLGAALILLIRTIFDPGRKWKELLFGGALGLAFLGVYFFIFQMFQSGSQQFDLGPDKIILAHFPAYFFLNWGALLIFGLAGLFYRSPLLPNRILGLFLAFCFLLIFFVRIVLAGFSDISLKVGHFSHVLLLLLAAGAMDRFLAKAPSRAKWLVLSVLLLVLPACVTWGMDLWNSLDIQNRKFTTYVKPEEEVLTEWMRNNLPPRTVVLNYSPKYDDFMRDILPPFSQRSVYLGDRIFSRIFQVSEQQVHDRIKVVNSIFHATDPSAVWTLSRDAGIQYVFVTDMPAFKIGDLLQKFSQPYFSLLIQDGNAALFRVNDSPS